MHNEVVQIREEFKVISKRSNLNSVSMTIPSTKLPTLPINTLDQLKIVERLLQDDTERANLISMLSNYATGSNLRGIVHKVMNNLLAPDLAQKYSLKGQGEKCRFINLNVCACVSDVVLNTTLGKSSHVGEVNLVIGRNLIGAKDRGLKRAKSINRTVQDDDDDSAAVPESDHC